MECLIFTHNEGVSFHFSEIISNGAIELMYENSGLKLKCPIDNTNFLRLSSTLFTDRGNVEVRVINNHTLIKKKKITSFT